MLNEKVLAFTLVLASIGGIVVSAIIGGVALLFDAGYGYTLIFSGSGASLVVGAAGFFINRYLNINVIFGLKK